MRNILVTGASRGLGLAITARLAASGFRVIAVARQETAPLTRTIADIASVGPGEVVFESADLAEIQAIPALVRRLIRSHGPLYGLVNNAAGSAEALLANMPLKQIEALVRLNTVSPLVLTKHVVRAMLAAGEGRIVNIASITAFTGYAGLSVYGATKASLIGLTRSLAREVGQLGITVNAIAPGFLDTDMTRGLDEQGRARIARRSALRRLAGLDDVASAVVFLLGPGAASITGTVVTVDAGATA